MFKINKLFAEHPFSNFRGEKNLDLCCGYGLFFRVGCEKKRIAANCVGIDGSTKMISIANRKNPRCDFKAVNISQKLPFYADAFDIVFCNQVLMDGENIVPSFSKGTEW